MTRNLSLNIVVDLQGPCEYKASYDQPWLKSKSPLNPHRSGRDTRGASNHACLLSDFLIRAALGACLPAPQLLLNVEWASILPQLHWSFHSYDYCGNINSHIDKTPSAGATPGSTCVRHASTLFPPLRAPPSPASTEGLGMGGSCAESVL